MRLRTSFEAMPSEHRVVKFFPSEPPRRGEIVLIDGERCKVTSVRVTWEGPRWKIRRLRARTC